MCVVDLLYGSASTELLETTLSVCYHYLEGIIERKVSCREDKVVFLRVLRHHLSIVNPVVLSKEVVSKLKKLSELFNDHNTAVTQQ